MQSRSRTVILSIIIVLLVLSFRLAWPWIYASYIWRESTIETLQSSRLTFNLIPRILHQTYRDNDSIPLPWRQASNSCRTLHSDYQYRFWSDIEGRRLIGNEFPDLLPTFDSYSYDIQRADVIRLVVLYVYGGIYLDLDIICLQSLDQLLNYDLTVPRTSPVGLSNDVIISKARHPFLLQLLENLPKANRNYLTKYPTVMFTTGPMYLTQQASEYIDRQSLNVLSSELYGKYTFNSSIALFRHLKASSWHGSDASMIKWIYHQRYYLLVLIVCLSMIMGIYFIRKSRNDYSTVPIEELDSWTVKYRKIDPMTFSNIFCRFLQRFK